MSARAPLSLDDGMLNAIEHSLDAQYSVVNGEHVLVGADYTLTQLLDFYAGVDPENQILDGYTSDGVPIFLSGDVHYSKHCLIRALVAEVRRLRSSPDDPRETP